MGDIRRQALVVGINRYPFLNKTPTGDSQHLLKPAEDAEAIAHILETYGDFEVHRLPTTEGGRQVASEELLKGKELGEAILRLFYPTGGIIPETALLYFAGHGLQKRQDGKSEGFLAASDASPRKDKWGISLQWLRQLLEKSPVRQQIIWLDCCHSGELFNFAETDLGQYLKGRDRCFIAASREFQSAFGGVLTPKLLQCLDPTQNSDGWVTNYTLKDCIEKSLKDAPQHPIVTNTGGQILLTGKHGIRENICPYRGLEYFDFNDEDPKYFYGRTALTNQLLEKVHQSNFLAVLGASGSGKSSVVRAGLLHQLKQGALSGSERWTIYKPFVPGEHPIKSIENAIGVRVNQLETAIKATPSERVLLVVDQFEEAFALCRDNGERQQFFECLMGAVKHLEKKLCLVVAMRADFFGKCAEKDYAGLAKAIEQNLVTVLPMSQEELREAITKPAERVGLEVERELITQMIADVSGFPGDLPLMQYTLTELWEQRKLNWLTISDYTRLGGVKKALEKHANEVYKSFSRKEQEVAKRIFLELTRLGEGTEDTRRQVRQEDLINPKQSEEIVDRVVQRLAKEKLIVTGEQQWEEQRVAIVNIAHEALIRNWNLLVKWLKENQVALLRKQEIEDAAQAWRDNRKRGEEAYLLQGTRLATAEDYLQRYADNVPLSGLAQEFVRKSIKHRQINRRNLFITITAVILGLSGLAIWALIEGEDARIRADSASSRALFAADRKLEALVASLRGAKRLKEPLGAIGAKVDTRIEAVAALRQSVYGIKEGNRLEGHSGPVLDVSISPDGQLIVSAGQDGTVKIWNNDGKLINTWSRNISGNEGGSIWQQISSVSFTPDGQNIAFPAHQDIQLIDRSGKPLRTLKYQGEEPPLGALGINSVTFSPDGLIVASGGNDNEIRFQTIEGKLIAILRHTNNSGDPNVTDISFSPDNKIIASGNTEGEIRLWNRDGQLLKSFQHSNIVNDPESQKRIVFSLAFSPDSQILASAGGDGLVKLWKKDGTLLATFSGHKDAVQSISFSPDGKLIATSSKDNTAKLWKIDGTLITTITGHSGSVNKVKFTPDGQKIVTASDDGTIRLWPLQTISVFTLKGHSSSITDVEFSPDGQMIATASEDRTIKLWNRDGTLLNTLIGHGATVTSVSFSPDSQMIASSENNSFRLWKRDGSLLKVIPTSEYLNISEVKFSPSAKIIAKAGSYDIEFLDYNGKVLSKIEGDGRGFAGISFSPDGQIITSFSLPEGRVYSEPPILKVWKVNGTFITNILGYKAIFSPDGKIIATSGEDGVIRLFKLDGTLINNLAGHSKKITDVNFSPDSQMLASASEDGTVKLWSRDGTLIETLPHPNSVNSLSFSPDGKTLVTAVNDGTLILWNLDLGDLLARGCDWARSYLENNSTVTQGDKTICKGIQSPHLVKQNIDLQTDTSKSPQVAVTTLSPVTDSEVGADYSLLKNLLAKAEFKAADEETRFVMLWLARHKQEGWLWADRYEKQGSVDEKSIEKIPCTDFRTIDRLWTKASNGRFGFSVQKHIYEATAKNFEKLSERVGWLLSKDKVTFTKGRFIPYSEYTFNLSAPEGHLPTSDAGFSSHNTDWLSLMKRANQCGL
ncbi:MAG TPA: hypothetical protein DDW76_09425 [Cyanobacteria bacterium UBA11369]|nr:hypothetical protein [Cyanobacteria bacterium UBA11371]HBE35614.1 hypothetical protein [Cyanobacteria bacterium UBA11368]HBE49000.1 hypothetical protein [Cyanobacteria bacterium UBA11369]